MTQYPGSSLNIDPMYAQGSLEAQSQTSQTARTATGSTVTGNFAGGFTVKSPNGYGGFAFEQINADEFKIDHPEFVTFYKDKKQVSVRRVSDISRIDAR
jgi:hypothetical protein